MLRTVEDVLLWMFREAERLNATNEYNNRVRAESFLRVRSALSATVTAEKNQAIANLEKRNASRR